MNDTKDNITKPYKDRQKELQNEFDSNWRDHFKELAENLFPKAGRFLDTDTKANDGKKRHEKSIDGVPMWALRTLASGMHSGLTSPTRPWFKLTLADKDLADYKPVRLWLDDVRDRILAVLAKSNFYTSVHGLYAEMGSFGTGAMNIDRDYRHVVRFYPFTIGQYTLDTDHRRRVDTIYRAFKLQVRNVVRQFGLDNVSQTVKQQYTDRKFGAWIDIAHAVEPNTNKKPDKLDNKNMPYKSVYYELASDENKLLSEKGYKSKPFVAPRWSVYGSEVYGRSPGMDALADVKMLYQLQKCSLKALAKIIDPPLNAPSNMKSQLATLVPGGINYIDEFAVGKPGLTPVYQVNYQIKDAEYKIEHVQEAVKKYFYADLFLLITSSVTKGAETAYEIARKYEEKLMALGPVIEQIQPEMLDDIIERVYMIMNDWGLIPPPPQELEGQEIDIELISLLVQAQKAVETSSIDQTVTFVAALSDIKPEAVDKLDADSAINEYAKALGTPSSVIRSAKEVSEIRQTRFKETLRQQKMDENERIVQGAKTLSEADTSGNNALKTYLEAKRG